MNIFYLDTSPQLSAQYLCDKHILKMGIEGVQILCTVKYLCKEQIAGYSLKPTHLNHPCIKWAKEDVNNYYWLWSHSKSILQEYTKRYNKIHKLEGSGLLERLRTPPKNITSKLPKNLITEVPQCMPEAYRIKGDAVTAYRNYYKNEKSKFAKWKLGNIPTWYKN